MRIYDTVMIGSGYSSIGYALARGNCLICEENEICDTHFYLPMTQYRYTEYEPCTQAGKELRDCYRKLGLFRDGMQNVNGFECGLCSFLAERELEILLKCRVVEVRETNEGYQKVVMITNSGLETVYAKNAVDTRGNDGTEGKYLTVLWEAVWGCGARAAGGVSDIQKTIQVLQQGFEGAVVEEAFYKGRYALYVPTDGFCDVNQVKLSICEKWKALKVDARIIYMAAVAGSLHVDRRKDSVGQSGTQAGKLPCDNQFTNPVAAFEAGYFCGMGKADHISNEEAV